MAGRLWDKGESLDAQVQQFTIGSDPEIDQELIAFDAAASAAHARMLREIGVLNAKECKDLLTALKKIATLHAAGNFPIPFEMEDGHTAIENFLVETLGETGKKIHTGRSRNDQVLVAVRLYARESLCQLIQMTLALAETFLDRAQETAKIVLPGHTHFQRAMPTSYGVWFHQFAECLLDSARAGMQLLERINTNPLGAASGFGVPLPLDRQRTATLLGFARVQRNPIAVISSRGRYELACIQWCIDTALSIEKFAFDVVLYCSEEFGFLSLPDHFTTGSSIMPQKRNPDVAELMRAKLAPLRGAATELEWVIAKLPSHYHRDHQLTKAPLVRAVQETAALLSMCSSVVKAVTICPQRAEAAMGPELFATYEAYRLVQNGVSFREAYQQAAKSYKDGNLDLSALRDQLDTVLTSAAKEMKQCAQEIRQEVESLDVSSNTYRVALTEVYNESK